MVGHIHKVVLMLSVGIVITSSATNPPMLDSHEGVGVSFPALFVRSFHRQRRGSVIKHGVDVAFRFCTDVLSPLVLAPASFYNFNLYTICLMYIYVFIKTVVLSP